MQPLLNRIRGHLIFEWKTNSYCATIIGVSFYCACRSISVEKMIDNGRRLKIERNLTKNRAQFDTFCIESLCGRR